MISLLLLAVAGPNLSVTTTISLHGVAEGCDRCHTPDGWVPARFDHTQVGYPLQGAHAALRCGTCHASDLKVALPRTCDGCHRDPHRGELGLRCEGCHEADDWRSRFEADAHRRSAFPLSGAHAVLPCEACHEDRFGRGFARAAARCVDCHAVDVQVAARTSIDHLRAGFGDDCSRCHTPWRFARARLPEHDRCFQIEGGPHGGIGCRSCHTDVAGLVLAGGCNTGNARCTSCHEHERNDTDDEHGDVPGYQYEDRKCYECHRFALD